MCWSCDCDDRKSTASRATTSPRRHVATSPRRYVATPLRRDSTVAGDQSPQRDVGHQEGDDERLQNPHAIPVRDSAGDTDVVRRSLSSGSTTDLTAHGQIEHNPLTMASWHCLLDRDLLSNRSSPPEVLQG
jgi:hypothetical protein